VTIKPNRRDMERHIELLTEPWLEHGLKAVMEIRYLNNGKCTHFHFDPTDDGFQDEAVSRAIDLNLDGWNIYVCVNPISSAHAGMANDAAIVDAYFAFADADDYSGAEKLLSAAPKPDFFVETGRTPTLRVHAYWQIDGIPNLEDWKQLQKNLIHKFGTDPQIINPSRIMRLAGTISWPSGQKRKRGYVPELTKLKVLL
jgi:hypothetical protein